VNSVVILLKQLEAYVQEEIGAQGRTLALLGAQDEALRSGEPHKVAASTEALEREMRSAPSRARRRGELLAGFAALWNLAPHTLTLSSIVDRSGDQGERLGRQRDELRAVVAKISRQARRNSTAARFHERFASEVLHVLLAVDGSKSIEAGGVLVDAQA
jgi:hypothetical protein